MQRRITWLVVVLVVQLAGALALTLRRDPLAGMHSDGVLIPPAAVTAADRLVIESKPTSAAAVAAGSSDSGGAGGASRVELLKKGDAWILPGAAGAPAEASKVKGLLDRLATLKRGLPIATSAAALARFKVAETDFARRLVLDAGDKTLATLYLGDSAGLRKSDARSGGEHAVYAVDLPTYEVPADTAGWLDAALLQPEASKLAEVQIAAGAAGEPIVLSRRQGADQQPDSWEDPSPPPGLHLDPAHAAALVQQLQALRVDSVLGTAAKPEWQQEHPLLSLQLKDEQARSVDWTLSKPSSGDFYVLKSSAHPWYFSLSATVGKQLADAGSRDNLLVGAKPQAANSAKR